MTFKTHSEEITTEKTASVCGKKEDFSISVEPLLLRCFVKRYCIPMEEFL